MLDNNYKITASLVLYKTKIDDLNNILTSVLESQIDILYIIDNSPSNVLYDHIKGFKTDRFVYIFGHGNVGFGVANNIGIEKSIALDAKYHIVLNPDIIFDKNVISELANFMDLNEQVGQVLPRVIYPNGNLQYLCKLLPTPIDIFARRVLPSKFLTKLNRKYEMHFTGYDKIWNCPILSGCFMFLRVSTLKDVGLFDSRFFMYFEDFDLMRRIHEKYETIYFPKVSIIHKHSAEHRTNKKLLRESIISAIKYFNKWGWIFDPQRRSFNKSAYNYRR